MWVALSFSVVVTVFVGCGGRVVYVDLSLFAFVQEIDSSVVFVIFLGFPGVVDVVRMGVVVFACVGRGCR